LSKYLFSFLDLYVMNERTVSWFIVMFLSLGVDNIRMMMQMACTLLFSAKCELPCKDLEIFPHFQSSHLEDNNIRLETDSVKFCPNF
jgi:hypothetical protein